MSPLLGLPLGRVPLATRFGGSGARQGGPGVPGCRRPRHALPHPCAERIAPRCRGNGNSYTLLFILKDTCSYLLLQSPQKIACHAEFLRGGRTHRSPPTSRPWGRASQRGGRGDAPWVTALRWRHSTGRRREGDPRCPWAGPGALGALPALCSPGRAGGVSHRVPPSPEMPGARDPLRLGVTGAAWPRSARCLWRSRGRRVVFSPVSSCCRGDRHSDAGAGPEPPQPGAAVTAARERHERAGGNGKRGKMCFPRKLPMPRAENWRFGFQKLPRQLGFSGFGLGASSLVLRLSIKAPRARLCWRRAGRGLGARDTGTSPVALGGRAAAGSQPDVPLASIRALSRWILFDALPTPRWCCRWPRRCTARGGCSWCCHRFAGW